MVSTPSRSKTYNLIKTSRIWWSLFAIGRVFADRNTQFPTTRPAAAPASNHSQLSRTLVYKIIICRSILPRTKYWLRSFITGKIINGVKVTKTRKYNLCSALHETYLCFAGLCVLDHLTQPRDQYGSFIGRWSIEFARPLPQEGWQAVVPISSNSHGISSSSK